MSRQRIAVLSAIVTRDKNRTIYYDRPLNNDTFTPSGIHLLIGCATLSFVIMFMCMMCYCYNRCINKISMYVQRRHLREAANISAMDIYTIEQFFGTEAYTPLYETQSAQSVLPPSYEDVMATQINMLQKYGRSCTSNTCCEHSHLNRSHPEQTTNDNINSTNTVEELRAIGTICDKANTDTEPQIAEPTMYDDNGNEMMPSQCSFAHCSGAANSSGSSSCCRNSHRMQNEGCCMDKCLTYCVTNDVQSANHSFNNGSSNNNNNGLSDYESDARVNADNTASQIQNDNNNTNNNNNPNLQSSMGASGSVYQCSNFQNNNDSDAELNILSDNGIIRMDMSKVIDQTGLPTYDAAIKLESFGYV